MRKANPKKNSRENSISTARQLWQCGVPILRLFLIVFCFACESKQADSVANQNSTNESEKDYIRKVEGIDEPLDPELIKRGEVLISYSDCSDCHGLKKRGKGPSFEAIAKRYPQNAVYISLLSRKIIAGGFGSWGSPVMEPHPELSSADAQAMAVYILSLEERPD